MNKYRIIEFESGNFGVQKRHWYLFWSLVGDQSCDPQGFLYTWRPYDFKTLEAAEAHVKLCDEIDRKYIIKKHP